MPDDYIGLADICGYIKNYTIFIQIVSKFANLMKMDLINEERDPFYDSPVSIVCENFKKDKYIKEVIKIWGDTEYDGTTALMQFVRT